MTSFLDMWGQMGLLAQAVVVVLVIMSVWSISVMIERFLTYRAARKQSMAFAPAVSEALKTGNIGEAIELAEQHEKSHLAKVLVAGLQEFRAHQTSDAIPGETIEASKRALQRATAILIEELKKRPWRIGHDWCHGAFCGALWYYRWHHQCISRHDCR